MEGLYVGQVAQDPLFLEAEKLGLDIRDSKDGAKSEKTMLFSFFSSEDAGIFMYVCMYSNTVCMNICMNICMVCIFEFALMSSIFAWTNVAVYAFIIPLVYYVRTYMYTYIHTYIHT